MARLFIGIMLPDDMKNKIEILQKEIAKLPLKAKFVEKENLHITLSFLGEVQETEKMKIIKELEKICEGVKKYEIELGNLLFIPNENYFRVIAINVKSEKLIEISKLIEEKIGGDVKPPHLTLCRIKNVENRENVVRKMKEMKFKANFFVNSIELIESKLTREGPTYLIIHSTKLKD